MQAGDENPYSSPSSPVGDVPVAHGMVDAGRWRRFFNWVLDYVATMVCVMVVAFCAALVGGDDTVAWLEGIGPWQERLLSIGIMLVYYIVMEGLFGLTVGKLVTGTRVVDEAGGPPTFRQAVLRSLSRLIPFEPFSLLFSDDGKVRGWHDSLPRTRVVLRNRRPVADGRVVG
jgi:uncharacterized RDD family membrane protein YckC